MSEIQVATRYAKSLIDLAEEQNALEQVKEDIVRFVETARSNPMLQAVLRNPIVGPDKKSNILNALFGDKMHEIILSFFRVVVRKGRSRILYATAREFINEYNRRKNIVKATVTSAAPLSGENRKEIEAVISKATNGEILLTEKVDPSLIGGFVIKVGDRQVDTSISGRLKKIKNTIKE